MSETPRHIAIIMDGNGRWAKQRNLPKIAGHKKGAESVKKAIEACVENNVSYLTLYAFSSENWSRPKDEVDGLMELLAFYLGKELKQLHKKNIKLLVIGDKNRLNKDVLQKISSAEELTQNNTSLTLIIALSYGSRCEIVNAAKSIATKTLSGELDISDINESVFSENLYTSNIPDPDLLIRTSGELRLSNFLLWQMAYTELCFLDVLWPDFEKKHVAIALEEFKNRERRFGS